MTVKLISDAARDLIVAEEVSSKATYEERYQRPEWPGGASGVTIGIGYDIGAGVKNASQLRADWGGRITDNMILALTPCIGVTGERAYNMLASVRSLVSVPWFAAIEVFDNVDVPRWYAICDRALPNFESLSLDCRGALLSLTYNRGASFTKTDDRYREMRAIKAHMVAKEFAKIPGEFRSMKRIWPQQSMRGLVLRREHEARLFEMGLAPPASPAAPSPEPAAVSTRATLHQGDQGDVVKEMQTKLQKFSTGFTVVADGDFGPVTAKALKAFQLSRSLTADAVCGPKTWAALA